MQVETEDGIEDCKILGPAKCGDPNQRNVKFADGAIEDWDVEDFRKKGASKRK